MVYITSQVNILYLPSLCAFNLPPYLKKKKNNNNNDITFTSFSSQQIRERVNKFEKFIEENDAKRRRAIQKYQTELKLKNQKNGELDVLTIELEQLKAR